MLSGSSVINFLIVLSTSTMVGASVGFFISFTPLNPFVVFILSQKSFIVNAVSEGE